MASGSSLTIREVLLYHSIDGHVFERLLHMSHSRRDAQRLTALWMWLERIGYDDLLDAIREASDDIAVRYVREGESILDAIRQDAPPPSKSRKSLPLISAMAPQPTTLRFFYDNRDLAIKGIVEVMNGIGRVVFDDSLRRLMATDSNNRALSRRFEQGRESSSENQRTMFLTFDEDSPVSNGQIQQYFSGRWGRDCIERVAVDETTMYGRVVFSTPLFTELALNRNQQAEFVIGGKKLWGYRP